MAKIKINQKTLTKKMLQGLWEQGFTILGRGSFIKYTNPMIDYLNKCRLTNGEADTRKGGAE